MQNINIADLRAKLNELKSGNTNRNFDFLEKFYNPPDWNDTLVARSTIRLLPGKKTESGDNELFFTETLLHKINGKNYHCPRKTGQGCPVCEYNRALWATEKVENIEIARDLKAKKRFYMNVIARERTVVNKKTGENEVRINDGPLIYSCGVKVFEKILKFMVDEEYGDLTDLYEGYDFQVRKEKQGDWPNYDDSKSLKNPSVAGTKDEIATWTDNLHDLNALIRHELYNDLKHQLDIYRGVVADPFSTKQATTVIDSPVVTETPSVDVASSGEGADDFFRELEKLRQK